MSTTFGVKITDNFRRIADDNYYDIPDGIIEVAIRSSGVRFKNYLATLLPDDTLVIPMDNGAQGIHTIGDIKKAIDSDYKLVKMYSHDEVASLMNLAYATGSAMGDKAGSKDAASFIACHLDNDMERAREILHGTIVS